METVNNLVDSVMQCELVDREPVHLRTWGGGGESRPFISACVCETFPRGREAIL